MRLVAVFIFTYLQVWGATCSATTQALAQNCLNTMNNGDTLQINGSGFTLSGSLQPPAALSNFTILGQAAAPPAQGAGTATTVLTDDGTNSIFIIQQTAGGNIKIGNFKAVYSGGTQLSAPAVFSLNCCQTSVRLTNITFAPTSAADRAIVWGQDWINGAPLVRTLPAINGLMDHITFTAAGTILTNNCIDGIGLYQGSDTTWYNPDNFGTTEGWYVEDSVLDESGCSAGVPVSAVIDGEHGARLIFRHNLIKDAQIEVHDASTLLSLGSRLLETDSNTFQCGRADCGFQGIQMRGGTGFHHNNTMPLGANGYENAWAFEITRVDSTGFQDPWFTSETGGTCTFSAGAFHCAQPKTCSDLAPHCDGVGGAGTSGQICGEQGETPGHPGLTGTTCTAATCNTGAANCGVCQSNPTGAVGTQSFCGSNPITAGLNFVLDHIDGTDTTGGYPAINQVGRGQYIPGNNPRNVLRPIYIWNNRDGGGGQMVSPNIGTTGGEDHFIVQNRDVFFGIDNTNCAAGAGICTAGVGQGILANRPTNCSNATFPGPGYFATDVGKQGTLYVCTATNTWTLWYQPLQYPHPLQTSVTGAMFSSANTLGGASKVQ